MFIVDGPSGLVRYRTDLTTASVTDGPVVVDLDLDGHAEILVGVNDNGTFDVPASTGLVVIGDRANSWAPTGGIWNQYAFHGTNVNPDGSIPTTEDESWLNSNTYRVNPPGPVDGMAGLPDLRVGDVTAGADGKAFTAVLDNLGAAPVDPGVAVTFYDGDPDRGGVALGTVRTTDPIPSGGTGSVTLVVDRLVNDLWVRADDTGLGGGEIAEDDEANNTRRAGIDTDPTNYAPRSVRDLTPSEAQVHVGRGYVIRPWLTDPDGDPFTFSLAAAPAGMQVHPTLGTIAWTPFHSQVGTHRVVLVADDGFGHTSTTAFVVTVLPPNTPPVVLVNVQADPGATFGSIFEYRVPAQDAEGDPLTFSLAEQNPGMSIDPVTGLFRWDVAAGSIVQRTAVVVVSDGRAETRAELSVPIFTSNQPNSPPVFRPVPPATTWGGRDYVTRVVATDADGDAVRYDLTTAPPGAEIDKITGIVRWDPTQATGTVVPFVAKATDSKGNAVQVDWNVAVTAVDPNRAPTVVSVPPAAALAVLPGELFAYDLRAEDLDGDPVVWSLVDGPRGMSINPETGTLRWVPAADQVGPTRVTVRVEDPATASTTQTFVVDVGCANQRPVILSTPVTVANVGSVYTYAVRATDPDGDPLTFRTVSFARPSGMGFVPGTAILRWTPTESQVGEHTVQVYVEDSANNVTIQSFTILVDALAPNNNPVITSPAPTTAATGSQFAYTVTARDPDGDPVTYRLVDGPAGMAIDGVTGLLTWTPQDDGEVGVTVEATDGRGGTAVQSFRLTARGNSAPTLAPFTDVTATAGTIVRLRAEATDPDGDAVAFGLVGAPAGMTVDTAGRISWAPDASQIGDHSFTVTASDGLGGLASRPVTVRVVADTTAPRVDLTLVPEVIDLGQTVLIVVTGRDDVGVTAVTLTADGVPLPLSQNGIVNYTPVTSGTLTIVATATDAAGNLGSVTRSLRVIDPATATGPVVTITSPAPGTDVTGPVDVVGTVTSPDAPLSFYRVYAARADLVDADRLQWDFAADAMADPDFVRIGGGTAEVSDGPLAVFDPTALTNDEYVIVVAAFDASGRGRLEPTRVSVTAGVKFGEFALSFTDLQVPVAGIPITITRTYDSREAGTEGDFGFGWTLGAADPRIRETVAQGGDGFFTTGGAFRVGTRVFLTNPDGERVSFTFHPEPTPTYVGAGFRPVFIPDPGVYDRLEVDSLTLTQKDDGTFAAFLLGFPYNPDTYRLTTPEGLTYEYGQFVGLRTVTDPNGNVLTYTRDGIAHSSGQSVGFVRDGRDRIVAVVDPAGNAVRYGYDAVGDLVTVTDQAGLVTRLTYDAGRPHYLGEVFDPLGNRAVRTEYDNSGRVVAVVDANGNRTTQGFDAASNTETVTDPLGQVTTLVYDDRGNVLSETDPLGHTTLRTYDSNDNVLTVADPLGRVTRYTFDARGNRTSVTDPLGNLTSYEYDRFGNVTKVTDPLGRETVSLYDEQGNPIGSVDAAGSITVRVNDATGRPLFETDANGNTTAYTYASVATPGPSTVTHPDGSSRALEYNQFGQVVVVTDEIGNALRFGHDASGRLLTITAPDGGVNRFAYAGTNLSSKTDPLGRVTRYDYDSANRLVRITDALDGITTYTFDANDQVLTETNPRGAVTAYAYFADGRLKTQTDALGGLIQYAYDAAGQLITITDPLARLTGYGYDLAGRLIRETDALGGATLYSYDGADNLLTITDRNGHTTGYAFDRLDRLVRETDALGGVTKYAYDSVDNMLSWTDANGHTTEFGYDNRNRLVSVTDPLGNTRSFGYDPVSNRTSVTDEAGNVTRSTFDSLGRLLSITDPAGGTTAYAYDLAGNLTSVTDPLGRVSTTAYDVLDRAIRETDPLGGVITYTFDAVGNQTSLTDPVGNTSTFGFDLLDRLVRETDPLGRSFTFAYDAVGNQTEVVDRNGRRRTFAFDALDRQTVEFWWAGTAKVYEAAYSYDPEGNLTSAGDPNSKYTFGYDALSRVITADNSGAPGVPRVVLASGYDAVGNRVSVADDTGVTVASVYDPRNLLTSRTWQGGGIGPARVDFAYDVRGLRVSTERFADLAGASLVGDTQYSHDAVGRVVSITHNGPLGNVLADYGYTFDLAGQVTQEVRDGVVIDYSYDKTSQLVGADRSAGPDEAYSYDANGNRTLDGYVIGPNNRLLADGKFTYEYDSEGNRVRRTQTATGLVTTYEFDFRNRLVRVTETDGLGQVRTDVRFVYDVFDRRIVKTVGGQSVVTVYDGEHAWADYDGNGVAVTRYLFGDRTDEILARHQSDTGTAWYLTDTLGSVRILTDGVGQTISRTDYGSFGEILVQTNLAASDRYTFTGREYDAEIGTYYYRARYYDAVSGRFMSEDPIRFVAGDANLNRYVDNIPTRYVDPTGTTSAAVTAACGFATRTALAAQGVSVIIVTSPTVSINGQSFAAGKLGQFVEVVLLTLAATILLNNDGNEDTGSVTISTSTASATASSGPGLPDPEDDRPRKKREKAKERRQREREQLELEREGRPKSPRNNIAQNRQFKEARRGLSEPEGQQLHREVSGRELDLDEMIQVRNELFPHNPY